MNQLSSSPRFSRHLESKVWRCQEKFQGKLKKQGLLGSFGTFVALKTSQARVIG
jgi:hypothetical protein